MDVSPIINSLPLWRFPVVCSIQSQDIIVFEIKKTNTGACLNQL